MIATTLGGCVVHPDLSGLPPPCADGYHEVGGVCVLGSGADAGVDAGSRDGGGQHPDAGPRDAFVPPMMDSGPGVETCNGVDDDRDTRIDEGPSPEGAPTLCFAFGHASPGMTDATQSANRSRVTFYMLDRAREPAALWVYVRGCGADQVLRGVIYAGDATTPTTVVAQTRETTVGASMPISWVRLPIDVTLTMPAGGYWLGTFTGDANDGSCYSNAGSGNSVYSDDPYADGPESPYVITSLLDATVVAFVEYRP